MLIYIFLILLLVNKVVSFSPGGLNAMKLQKDNIQKLKHSNTLIEMSITKKFNINNNANRLKNSLLLNLRNYNRNNQEMIMNSPTKLSMTATSDASSSVIVGGESNGDESKRRKRDDFKKLCQQNWLVLGEVIVILIAKHYPQIMASGGHLKAEWLVGKLGVFVIFFLNGLALSFKTQPSEIKSAMKTNALVQVWNMAIIPAFAFAFSRFYPDKEFLTGLLVLSCVPQTINISVAQTMSAGGDMGTAIFNAIFGNLLGVILTPLLAVLMVGAGSDVSLLHTLKKLGVLVVAPMAMGQVARRTPLVEVATRYSKQCRFTCSCILLCIVWNTFSDTFIRGIGITGGAFFRLLGIMPLTYMALSYAFWRVTKVLLPGLDYSTRAAALFCSSQKTLAFGIPFIKTAFAGRADLAQILAPLLLYAPAELLIGSTLMVPKMSELINSQSEYKDGGGI